MKALVSRRKPAGDSLEGSRSLSKAITQKEREHVDSCNRRMQARRQAGSATGWVCKRHCHCRRAAMHAACGGPSRGPASCPLSPGCPLPPPCPTTIHSFSFTRQVAEDLFSSIFAEDFDRIVPVGGWGV